MPSAVAQIVGSSASASPMEATARILVAMHHGEPTAAIGYILSKRKGKGLDHTPVTQAEAELRD